MTSWREGAPCRSPSDRFGFKHGLPLDADRVRFLKNPYWVDELRHLTGKDQAVADYVLPAGCVTLPSDMPTFAPMLSGYLAG